MKILNGVLVPRLKQAFTERNRTARIRAHVGARIVSPSTPSALRSLPPTDAPYRFLVIRRLGGIGDVIMSTPMLRGLKEKFPNCHITYATNPDYASGSLFAILNGNPYIDSIINVAGVAVEKFDFHVDITSIDIEAENNSKSPPNRIDIYCDYVGVSPSSYIPYYKCTESELGMADKMLSTVIPDYQEKRLVFINPASNTQKRDIPVPAIQSLVDALLSDPRYAVVLSHHFDHGISHPKLAKFICDIRTMSALIAKSNLIVSHDTGILHIAGALEKKIVALFGSTNPTARIGHYQNATAIWKTQLPCVPCWYSDCSRNVQFECMKIISTRDIMQMIEISFANPSQLKKAFSTSRIIEAELI